MTQPAQKRRYTVDEYLRMERDATEKHEFHDGEILAMSGGTVRHSLIAANVSGEIRNRLKGKPCRAYESNLRVSVPPRARLVYPDVSIICGRPQLDPSDTSGETVTNPTAIVEVLSPSTSGYDRGEKFDAYRQIATLQEYILVSQTNAQVESYFRQSDGTWLLTVFGDISAIARIRSMQIEIPLAEIYAGVEFTPATESNPNPT